MTFDNTLEGHIRTGPNLHGDIIEKTTRLENVVSHLNNICAVITLQ